MSRLSRLTSVTLVATGLLCAAAAEAYADKKVVAVLPFSSPTKYGSMGRNAQPSFITELVKSRKVRVVDEKRATNAVKRFEREMTGLYEQKTIRQIGRFLKADYVVSGQISYLGDAFTMTVHVTNVETLELEMAEDVDFRDAKKMRRAVRTAARKIAGLVSGTGAQAKKSDAFLNIDARAFYDTADRCIDALKRLDAWRYEGEVDEELGGKKVHVKLRYGKPKPGMPLAVFEEGLGENDRPVGVVYVVEPDERGSGFLAKWIKERDKDKKKRGSFGLGARVSNSRYRYRIAIGRVDDEAEDNAQLVAMFRDKMLERLEESDKFIAKTGGEITPVAVDLGRGSTRKKNLKKLHREGVDFLIEGKLIGDPGSRRADFKVISAFTGEVWGRLRFETSI